jgi:asparagine synthetase B (glutamine-hydrolysing)
MAVNVGAALTADGCRVSLCGEGGDEWLTGRRFYYNEQLAARQWSELRRTLWADIAACGPAAATWWLVRFGLAHLLPRSVLDPIRRTLSPRGPTPYKMAFWLAGEDADLLAARRSRATGPVNPTIPNLPRRLMLANLVDPFPSMVRDHMARQSARIGYEVRFQMYARQFIEFCFETPELTRLRGTIRKHVHVQAMAELLPAVVRDRRTKGEFSVAFARQLDRMQSRFAGPATAISSRMTSPRGAGQLYDCYLEEPYGRKPIWELWGMFGCGFPRRSDQATDLLRSIQSDGTKGQS